MVDRSQPLLAREDIIALIAHRAFVTSLATMHGIVHEVLCADHLIYYAFDTPDSFQYMQHADLSALGMEAGDLRAFAVENLRRKLPNFELHGEAPLLMLDAGGNFEASLLLLDSLWDQIGELLEGELAVATPARDLVFVTGTEELGGLQALRNMVDDMFVGASYPISDQILRREAGRWVPTAY
ncbi:MAG: DUF1444 family protein [Bradymonadaceae bacterium]|nr:DUF1444 family protein [Lujinxingiaceae bacterium]